jgi:hypothetical protein
MAFSCITVRSPSASGISKLQAFLPTQVTPWPNKTVVIMYQSLVSSSSQ